MRGMHILVYRPGGEHSDKFDGLLKSTQINQEKEEGCSDDQNVSHDRARSCPVDAIVEPLYVLVDQQSPPTPVLEAT